MADIRPFRGLRFDPARVSLSRALCPPYDVIGPAEARRFRRSARNAIHVELPEGAGAAKYRNAARTWEGWLRAGLLKRDEEPSFYVCEQSFKLGARTLRRTGFLAAMGVSSRAAKAILPHERTLSKPKEDRFRLLKAVKANVSPIFGLFPDASGAVQRALNRAKRARAVATGVLKPGVRYRLWRLSDPGGLAVIGRSLASKRILIADGHHRFAVGRRYYEATRRPGAGAILTYLCPEEDAGLVLLPTHRVAAGRAVVADARRLCRVRACRSLEETLARLERSENPYAFGLCGGGFALAEPKRRGGARSGLCVEWLARSLLKDIPPDLIRYTHDAREAAHLARSTGGTALLVKPARVAQVRRAVRAVGLLPPKSTYFHPKIGAGLVFKPA